MPAPATKTTSARPKTEQAALGGLDVTKKHKAAKSKPASLPVLPARGMTVATRLKEVRDAIGDTNAALARRLRTDDAYSARQRLSTYVSGRSEPGLMAAEMIAESIGIAAPYLFATDPELAAYILSYPGKGWRKKIQSIDLNEWAAIQRDRLPKVEVKRMVRRVRDGLGGSGSK
jgi:transcriptional regulator with XRE-family HTH domain